MAIYRGHHSTIRAAGEVFVRSGTMPQYPVITTDGFDVSDATRRFIGAIEREATRFGRRPQPCDIETASLDVLDDGDDE